MKDSPEGRVTGGVNHSDDGGGDPSEAGEEGGIKLGTEENVEEWYRGGHVTQVHYGSVDTGSEEVM